MLDDFKHEINATNGLKDRISNIYDKLDAFIQNLTGKTSPEECDEINNIFEQINKSLREHLEENIKMISARIVIAQENAVPVNTIDILKELKALKEEVTRLKSNPPPKTSGKHMTRQDAIDVRPGGKYGDYQGASAARILGLTPNQVYAARKGTTFKNK